MVNNSILQTRIQDLSEIQSQLANCGNESLKLASELAVHTLTLSTQPDEAYRKLKENLVWQSTVATCAMKSISQHLKSGQQSVASAPSTLSTTTNGNQAEWLETLSDSWTTCFNSLLTTHQKNLEKLYTQHTESVQSALEQWDGMATSSPKELHGNHGRPQVKITNC